MFLCCTISLFLAPPPKHKQPLSVLALKESKRHSKNSYYYLDVLEWNFLDNLKTNDFSELLLEPLSLLIHYLYNVINIFLE